MKLEYFHYMIEIANIGSISKAAENLYVSQPYLSLELKNLEKSVGAPLFIRNNRGVSLTSVGEKLLEYSKQVIALLDKVDNLREYSNINNEALTISCMYAFTFLDIYHEFSIQHNDEDNIVYEETENTLIPEKVKNTTTDVGIIYIYTEEIDKMTQKFSEQGMTFTPLVNEPLCIIVNKNHPLAKEKSVNSEHLKEYRLILEKQKNTDKNASVKNIIMPLISKICTLKPLVFDNNRSLLYYITKNETCFTVGQHSLNLTNPFLVSGDLVYIPIRDLRTKLTTGYLINDATASSYLQEEFITYLESFFRDYINKL